MFYRFLALRLSMRSKDLFGWLAFILTLCSADIICADEGEVRAAIKSYVTAFNNRDLATIEKLWSETAVYVDQQTGERTEGRSKIVQDIKTVFESKSLLNLAGTIEHIRIIKEDVATVDGQVSLSTDSQLSVNQFSALLLKKNGQWTIDTMEERAIALPLSAADALQELAWLVGEWQDASSDSPVRSLVKSAVGGAFLVRSFEATSDDGGLLQSTQIIGWDPRAQQFRSWTFDADGSFGDGVWSKNDNQWLIKSTQTLADGSAASGTYVLTIQNADAFTVQLIGREIEGEPQPASPVVTVQRTVADSDATSTATPSN
jgi:ketosteroid isomerase-like protein